MTIIATPIAIKAKPAALAKLEPGELSGDCLCDAMARRNKSNLSITKPNAITAIAVRTQARKVRSLAAWSL
jgi:hypothetical protein